MKLFSKLSALGAVLVMTTAFASADSVIVSSAATTWYQGYISYPGTPPPTGVKTPADFGSPNLATFDLNPGTTWAAPLSSGATPSSWIGGASTWGPGGGVNPGFGYYLYEYKGTTDAGQLNMRLYADDTVEAWVLSGGVYTKVLDAGSLTPNTHCANSPTGCDLGTQGNFVANVLAGDRLFFIVTQAGTGTNDPSGLDFAGAVSGQFNPVPEPSSLLMLGTGLLGSAGMMMRRMRASRS